MGRLKDLVSKVKDEVAPIASVVKEEVVHKVRERVLSTPKAQAATGHRDEWAFKPVGRPDAGSDDNARAAMNGSSNSSMNGSSAGGIAASSADSMATPVQAAPTAEAAVTKGEGAMSAASGGEMEAAAAMAAGAQQGGVASNGAGAAQQQADAAAQPPATPAAQIKITAQPSPTDPSVCKFTVEVPVFEERMVRIRNREAAAISPLAQRLFEIPQVSSLTFSGNIITVSKTGPEPWPMIARQIGPAIRAHIASGQPALTGEPDDLVRDAGSTEELRAKVQHVIDSLINPGVASHGGYVTLLGVDADTAYISMGGGCQGCGMADLTLKQGISQTIMSQVPEIVQVLDSTDHASGENPFFASGR